MASSIVPPNSDGKAFRPQHKKQPSRSNIFKALVSPTKQRPNDAANGQSKLLLDNSTKSQSGSALGERHLNVQSKPVSPRKLFNTDLQGITSNEHTRQDASSPLKENRSLPVFSLSPKKYDAVSPSKDESARSRRSAEEIVVKTSPSKHDTSSVGSKTSSNESNTMTQAMRFMKRGTKVMAAVAALQSKDIPAQRPQSTILDQRTIESEFEAMLDARHIPSAMRQNMRDLTLRVKADLVRQNHESSIDSPAVENAIETEAELEVEEKSTKRSRPRSRTFTFSKGDRGTSSSPTKKQRSRSRSRAEAACDEPSTPRTPRSSSRSRRSKIERPEDYIKYLKAEQDPTKVEVGRLHKLRILLRNETVAWVNEFIDLDGMSYIITLLQSIMALEWREEHEDQLLHETLLCLKGLCTTDTALAELEKYAEELFPALLGMLFDDEKKGPAEYTTRTVIINVLFAYLAAHNRSTSEIMEARARQVLRYLGEPLKAGNALPHTFVTDMHVSRPYKLWSREVSNVTKEVFWIFLHQLNVISSRPNTGNKEGDFTSRHFPGIRPPVPAAPYIGGVEWDATTYLAAHLDLLNGVIASLPSTESRNELRSQIQASGFEKTMGGTLRTCKEKFYAGVHDGLRSWVAAAKEDGWPTSYVCEGPSLEEQAQNAKSSPKKAGKQEPAPQLGDLKMDMPALDLKLDDFTKHDVNDDTAWLG